MNIEPVMKKRLYIGIAVFVAVLLVSGYFNLKSLHKPTTVASAVSVPTAIIAPATTYIQAHEDAIGADRSSPSSWTDAVKSVVTDSWYQHLQPAGDSQTGTTPYSYQVAHDNNYRVMAMVSNCDWVGAAPNLKTAATVTINCAVSDSVVDANNAPVDPTTLPYGWSNVGQQAPAVLTLTKQGNSWLVSDQSVDQQTE